jgi:carotenoid epsilon hydroxylase
VERQGGEFCYVVLPSASALARSSRSSLVARLSRSLTASLSNPKKQKQNIPVADAKPDDIKDLLGGALFKALFKWMVESGPVYLLPTGPISSFLVISDPSCAKHVLRATDNPQRDVYGKGLVAEVSQFLFGDGFAITGGDAWRVRRRAVAPSLHRAYLEEMLTRVFSPTAAFLCDGKLAEAARSGKAIDMEAAFSQLTLDVIGKSVFNYDFNALTRDSPLIQAVYTSLKETEQRATDLLPLWKLPVPLAVLLSARQRKAQEAVALIRRTTSELIARCKAMVDDEEMAAFAAAAAKAAAESASSGNGSGPAAATQAEADEAAEKGYLNEADPSVLRFLIAAREEASSTQLRDDLLSMLVAGHETTGSALTWTMYFLALNPDKMRKAVEEVDRVLGGGGGGGAGGDAGETSSKTNDDDGNLVVASAGQYSGLRYITRCVLESMRLYPHPPVLLRRARVRDELPLSGYLVEPGQDVMISVYNIHRSPAVWGDDADDFVPERFGPLDAPVPNEQNTDYRFIPFSGGPRKCVGDQFAVMEAVVALAVVLRRYKVSLVPGQDIGLTTGATIHTTNGLYMTVEEREEVVNAGKGKGKALAAAA